METDIKTSEEKKDLTLDMVMRVLKLSKLQIRNIFSAVLKTACPADSDSISADNLRCLLIADLLERLDFLKAEQRLLILEGVCAANNGPPNPDLPGCLQQLVFMDGRYCTWTGQIGFTDLDTGDTLVGMLPDPPLESIAYNLNELYRRGVLQIENRAGFHVKKPDAGSVAEPGNICQRAADAVS